MNKLGIIGGMGPLATNIFYSRIIFNTKASSDQEHIWTVISSHSTMPDRTNVIEYGLDKSEVLDAVSEDIKIMECANVTTIAIPCNTFHYFYNDVQKLTSIPIINMIDETMKTFSESLGKNALVLSTTGTKKANVYEKYSKIYGVNIINIEEEYTNQINDIIYDIKKTNNTNRPDFLKILEELFKNYNPDGIILACTELSSIPLDQFSNPNKILDAMNVLVEKSIIESGYKLKK